MTPTFATFFKLTFSCNRNDSSRTFAPATFVDLLPVGLLYTPGTAIVAEVGGQPAGGIITYDIGTEPEEIEEDTPGVFVPMIELENLAPCTHYINAIAVFPHFKGQGIGRKLLRAVYGNALENGMSLIAEDANPVAIGLYESEWFVEVARRPIVETPGWTSPGKNWILMVRPPE